MAAQLPSLLHRARPQLLVAAALLAGALALAWVVQGRQQGAMASARDATAQLAQARADLDEAQEARTRLEANLRQYEALRQGGFIGAPDRVALLEGLEQAARGLAAVPLRWEMEPLAVVETVHDPKHGQPLAEVGLVPMRIQADHVHEAEWLALLDRLQQAPQGQVRVEGCSFARNPLNAGARDLPALRADCALSWVHVIPVPQAAPEGAAR